MPSILEASEVCLNAGTQLMVPVAVVDVKGFIDTITSSIRVWNLKDGKTL
jgi:hypothetical protein